ncbi:MAG: zinc metalloprotease HtpX [Candidatus Omnitrophota bacterium]
MPFSFIDIEEKKTKVIGLLFFVIILFYFLTVYLVLLVVENIGFFSTHTVAVSGRGFAWPAPDHVLIGLGVAFLIALLHWAISTSNLIEKISLSIGAFPIESNDTYHQFFKNIVDEVSVAIGGRPLEARVIPTISMNAFALEDFNGRAVIGITEGLLARLSRAQIEAVVGHEAGHIASGDCLSTTVTCSLAELYEEGASKIGTGLRRARGQAGLLLLFAFLVIKSMSFLSKLLRYFISREREYRADAAAVRLTRDPLSLAEALLLISRGWRGEGQIGDRMQSIFIMNPASSELDERQGVFPDMFSTHPPVERRIDILLNMAHSDVKTLQESMNNFKRVSPVAQAEFSTEDVSGPKQWFVFSNQKWLGPFDPEALSKVEGLKPDHWVLPVGEKAVRHLYEDESLLKIFRKDTDSAVGKCPHCKTSLSEVNYEGTPVLKCVHCAGVFVSSDKISRILIRQDKTFSQEVLRLAKVAMDTESRKVTHKKIKEKKAWRGWVLDCPKCGEKMRRQFFVYSYPIEIDRCVTCEGIWFDATELEILQYIYEHRDKFFDGTSF